MNIKDKIYGFEDFGITLSNFKGRNYLCDATISFLHLEPNDIGHLPIKERRKEYYKYLRDTLKIVSPLFPQHEICGTKQMPHGIKGTFNSKALYNISKNERISLVGVSNIEGLSDIFDELPDEYLWYNAICHYVIQVENQTKGRQIHETRHVMVRAKDFDDAKSKVLNEAKNYSKPYFGNHVNLARWHLVEIIDIVYVKDFDNLKCRKDDVKEVHSEIYSKNFQKFLFWDGKY